MSCLWLILHIGKSAEQTFCNFCTGCPKKMLHSNLVSIAASAACVMLKCVSMISSHIPMTILIKLAHFVGPDAQKSRNFGLTPYHISSFTAAEVKPWI